MPGEGYLQEEGVVVEVAGDRCKVQTERGNFCEACPGDAICSLGEAGGVVVVARDPLGVRVGQKVKVAVQARRVLHASMLAYGVPLVCLLLGVFVGYSVGKNVFLMRDVELSAAGGGVVSLALSLVGLRWVNRRVEKDISFWPVVIEVMRE